MNARTSASLMPWRMVLLAARRFTTQELCQYADEAHADGNRSLEAGWLEALSIHARLYGWDVLIEASMLASLDRKEEQRGVV